MEITTDTPGDTAVTGRAPADWSFRRFWSAVVVSQVGSEVTLLALPLLVVLTLQRGSGAVGLVTAAEYLPWLLLSLPAGVLVDRRARRPVLVTCDVLRAAVLALVPLAAWRGVLTLPVVLAVVFAAGCLTVVFDIASNTYLPEIVPRARLGAANGALGTAGAIAFVAGPPLGGALVGLVGASRAVLIDAVSFLVSGALVLSTRPRPRPTPVPDTPPEAGSHWQELTAGLRLMRRVPVLGWLAAYSGVFNLASNGVIVVLLVFLVRDAHLSPTALGLVYGISACGAIVGGMLSSRLAGRLGIGRSLALTAAVVGAGEVLLAATPANGAAGVWVVVVMGTMFAANTAFNAQVMTVRQGVTPQHLLGRLMAASRMIAFATIPVGAVVGGLLGDAVGRRPTLVVLAAFLALVSLIPFVPAVRRLREPLEPVGVSGL